MMIEKEMFNSNEEYNKFKSRYGENVKVYEVLEEYCINDAKITKESIIKY